MLSVGALIAACVLEASRASLVQGYPQRDLCSTGFVLRGNVGVNVGGGRSPREKSRHGLRAASCASSPMEGNKLLHAMIRVPAVDKAVEFWKERGANVLSASGKGSCFVGYGEYRDATFFALELSPTPAETIVSSNVLAYFGISMLPPGRRLPAYADADAGDR